MIKNFHFKMLIAFGIFSFFMGFAILVAANRYNLNLILLAVGGLFVGLGFVSAMTAQAIRSISRRLDEAGIAEDPQFPISRYNKAWYQE